MPCISTVRVWYDENNRPVHYELSCADKCKDNDTRPCTYKVTMANTPSRWPWSFGPVQSEVTEFCACDGGDGPQSSGCHIVLVTVHKPADAPGVTKMSCRGNACRDTEKCTPVRVFHKEGVPILDPDGNYSGKMGKWIDFQCKCEPKRETFRRLGVGGGYWARWGNLPTR